MTLGKKIQGNMSSAAGLLTWGQAVGNVDEFRAWQNDEHLPERAAVLGFHRCRRFASIDGGLEFLTIYEVSGTQVFNEPAYRSLLASPSLRTRAMLATPAPGIARLIGREQFRSERAAGGLIGVWRFDLSKTDGVDLLEGLRGDTLARFADDPALCALRLFEGVDTGDDQTSEALKSLSSALAVPAAAVVAEGWGSEKALRESCAALSAAMPGAPPFRLYRMEVLMTGISP